MRLNETIETHGHFWLPSRPENKVVGFLRISETGESTLELFGSLQKDDDESHKLHIILGAVDKGGAVTLKGCLISEENRTWNFEIGGLTKTTILPDIVFVGAHFGKDIKFTHLEFSIEGLNEWFYQSGSPISKTYDEEATNFFFSYKHPEPIELRIDDNLHLAFFSWANSSHGKNRASISMESSIYLKTRKERTFNDLLRVASSVKEFLCLAFDNPVPFTTMAGYLGVSENQARVQIYATFDLYSLEKRLVHNDNPLFKFKDVDENIELLLQKWISNCEEFEPTFKLYYSVMTNRYLYLEERFLFLAQGLESLHRRSSNETHIPKDEFDDLVTGILEHVPEAHRDWINGRLKYANELPLRKRIKDMTDPFSTYLWRNRKERTAFIDKVVNSRNYYTHYDLDSESKAATEKELARICYNLEDLLKLHLLKLSGIEDERIIERVKKRASQREL